MERLFRHDPTTLTVVTFLVVTLLVLGHCLDCALSSEYPSFDTSRSSCLIQWQWGLLQLNTY